MFRIWNSAQQWAPCSIVGMALISYGIAFANSSEAEGRIDDWTQSLSIQTWTYHSRNSLFANSLLNPGNRVAQVADSVSVSDTRLDLSLRSPVIDLVLKPRLLVSNKEVPARISTRGETFVSQGFGRIRVRDNITVTAGRELLTWGPSNFRSPSNPFYYDAGKTSPLQDVPGVDLVRTDWAVGSATTTLGYVEGGRGADQDWRRSTLLKADLQGPDYVLGAVWTHARRHSSFVGGYAQVAVGDAILLYGEVGSSPKAPEAATDSVQEGAVDKSKPSRGQLALLGSTYTLLGGQSVSVEYLHDSRGFRRAAAQEYFDRLPSNPTRRLENGGVLLNVSQYRSGPPQLFGRDYIFLLYQSNLQDQKQYWRLSTAINLQDLSTQTTAYLEHNVSRNVSLFGSILVNRGNRNTEFGSVLNRTVTLGAKFFIH